LKGLCGVATNLINMIWTPFQAYHLQHESYLE